MPLRLFSPRRVLNFLDVILFQIWRTLCPRCLKVSETAFWNKKLAIFLLELKEFCSPHVRSEFGLGCSHSDWAVLIRTGLFSFGLGCSHSDSAVLIRTRLFSFGLGCSQASKAFESKCTHRYTAWADQCGWQPCRADSTRVFHLPMIRLGGAEMGSYLANFIGLFYLFCYCESW